MRYTLVLFFAGLWLTPTVVHAENDTVSLIFAGDVMLARNLSPFAAYNPTPLDFAYSFEAVVPIITGADIAFCNLECPISGRGTRMDKQYSFNAPPLAAYGLKLAGFDVVSMANNHCLDFGLDALGDTQRNLDAMAIKHAGICGENESQAPAIFDINGVKIGYLAYLIPRMFYGGMPRTALRPALMNEATFTADITRLRDQADIVIVSCHWGNEYTTKPREEQARLGRLAIDAGAHVVVGHHPHVQQDPEQYHGGLILHSLGNFVFARYVRPAAENTRLFRVQVNHDGIQQAEFLPLRIVPGRWRPEPQAAAWTAVGAFPYVPPPPQPPVQPQEPLRLEASAPPIATPPAAPSTQTSIEVSALSQSNPAPSTATQN